MNETQRDHLLSAIEGEIDRLNLIKSGVENSNSAAELAIQKWADGKRIITELQNNPAQKREDKDE